MHPSIAAENILAAKLRRKMRVCRAFFWYVYH